MTTTAAERVARMRGTRPGKHPAAGEVSPPPPRSSFPHLTSINTPRGSGGHTPQPPANALKPESAGCPPTPSPTALPQSPQLLKTITEAQPSSPRERRQSGRTPHSLQTGRTDIDSQPAPTPPYSPEPVLTTQRPHPDNLTAYIEHLIAQAPPLTDSQRAALRVILTTHKRSHIS